MAQFTGSARFRQEIDDWRAEGLITPDQQASLYDRYELHGTLEDPTPWFLRTSFILRAVALIFAAAAALLLISENWQRLGVPIQTTLGLAPLLLAYALGFYHEKQARQGNPGAAASAELDLFFASLLLGLNIFLQAQIYHLSSYWPNGVLWWAIGAMPLAFRYRSALHTGLVQVLLFAWLCTQYAYEQFHVLGYALLAIGMVAAWWYPARLLLYVAVVNVVLAVFRIDIHLERLFGLRGEFPGLPLAGATALVILRLLPSHGRQFTSGAVRAVSNLAYWTCLGALYLLTFNELGRWALLAHPSVLGILFVLGVVIHILWRRHPSRTQLVALAVVLFQLLVQWYGSLSHLMESTVDRTAVAANLVAYMANALLFGLALFRIYAGRRYHRKPEFMEGISILVLLALTRYIDYFEDYVTASLMFLACSALLWGVNWYWNRSMTPAKSDAKTIRQEGDDHV